MNLNNVNKINKILKENLETPKGKNNKATTIDFDKILDEKIAESTKEVKRSHSTPPVKQLLNIKETSTENIFIEKGFKYLNDLTLNLEKFERILNSDFFDINEANNTIKLIKENINILNTITENIKDISIKKEFNKAITIGNIEVEKYLRGDYFI